MSNVLSLEIELMETRKRMEDLKAQLREEDKDMAMLSSP